MTNASIKIPAELFGLSESSRFDGTIELEELRAGPDVYTFEAPLEWAVEVTNTGSALLVAGSVTGEGTSRCSRCLENVTHSFEGDIEGYFLVEGSQGGEFEDEEGEEVGEDEFDVLPADHIIDLEPLIVAALLVDAPQMPLCREDCAGLCPTCGSNLNEGPCGCTGDADLEEFEKAVNPFAALKDYRFDDDAPSV